MMDRVTYFYNTESKENGSCRFRTQDLKFWQDHEVPAIEHRDAGELAARVAHLKTHENEDQRSERWFQKRSNAITASALAVILGLNPYESNVDDIILEKCGHPLPRFSNNMTAWGQKYEPVSAKIYEAQSGHRLTEFGLLFHDEHSFLAASPDGIRDDGVMLEIKNVTGRQITGLPPVYYYCQVQLQLEVCNLERCDFLETEIKEYSSREYINDTCHPYKGAIVTLFNEETDERQYLYSDLGMSYEQLVEWRDSITAPSGWLRLGLTFWYLHRMSCVPIYRDREWFARYFPVMRSFWDRVEHHRVAGCQDILSRKAAKTAERSRKRGVRLAKKAATAPLIDDDSAADYSSHFT